MSVLVIDADALRALVREEVRLALEPVLAAVSRLGGTQAAGDGDGLLDRDAVAAMLGVDVRDLRRLEIDGTIPPPIRIGRRVRWRRPTLDAWLARLEKKMLDAGARGRLHVTTMRQTADLTGDAG